MKKTSFIIPEPVSEAAQELKSRLSEERWDAVASDAFFKSEILEWVQEERECTGQSWRKCLEDICPDVGWSRYLHWRRAEERRSGPKWERHLDRRVPPPPEQIPETVRSATVTIRMVNPDISYDDARAILLRQFGEVGRISNTSLGRIWRDRGMTDAPKKAIVETVELFHGGAGLAFIGVAACETGAVLRLAEAAFLAGQANASTQVGFAAMLLISLASAARALSRFIGGDIGLACGWITNLPELHPEMPLPTIEGRTSSGHFSADYNKAVRVQTPSGKADPRWSSDARKRYSRDLKTLETLNHCQTTLADRLLAIGLLPLIAEQRGFDGADAVRGGWLELAGIHPYRAATLDKSLSELALLNVGEAMWNEHGRQWREITLPWCEDGKRWLRFAFYIDATADPYWTRHYAASGLVSRIGKVRPCLSRICVTGGPGVPLLVETHAGSVSLKKALVPMLERIDEIVGDEEVAKLTIVDAEIASAAILSALCEANRSFITVLKGHAGRSAVLEDATDWVAYREQDRLREGFVTLQGTGTPKGGLRLRAVQMERKDSRNPTPTLFVHNVELFYGLYVKEWEGNLRADEVADAYLSRWPNQEQLFRDTRNGAGLERSHGYGGEFVSHVALDTKLEKVSRTVQRAEAKWDKAKDEAIEVAQLRQKLEDRDSKATMDLAVRNADQKAREAEADLQQARKMESAAKSTPRLIYKRDTTRENIATVLSLTVMMLLEFVLKEYFGGLKIELRTFIERLVGQATTVRKSRGKIVYQIEGSDRDKALSGQLLKACAEVTRRKLRRGGQLLVFEVVDPPLKT